MADVNEVLRLMRHAADLLDEQTEPVSDVFGYALLSGYSDRQQIARDQAAWAAASGLAMATLRMVAAFMTEQADAPLVVTEPGGTQDETGGGNGN